MNDLSDFSQVTLTLLHNRPAIITLSQISKATNLKHDWLNKFNRGKIDNKYKNSEAKIQTLYDYLVSKQKEQPALPL